MLHSFDSLVPFSDDRGAAKREPPEPSDQGAPVPDAVAEPAPAGPPAQEEPPCLPPTIIEVAAPGPAAIHRNGTHLTSESVPVYFVFRKNGIYENYLNLVRDVLESQGRKVKLIGIDADVRNEEIPAELKKHSIPYDRIVLYTDRTVGSRLPAKLVCPGLSPSNIDSIFSGCGLVLVCRELGIEAAFEVDVEAQEGQTFLQAYLDAHRERFQGVFGRALRTKQPDMIVIDSRCMNEHIPFYVLSSKYPERQAARFVRRWIAELGFPAEKIMVTHDVSKLDPEGFIDCSRIWFIGDRHWQDKPPGRTEISRFIHRLSKLQYDRRIDEAIENGREQRELEEFDRSSEEEHMPWDGDDGIDALDQIEIPESDLDEPQPDLSPEETEELNEDIARLDRNIFNLHYLSVPQPRITVKYLALPMDSLLESMVAQDLLPISHQEQGQRFAALAAERISDTVPGLVSSVIREHNQGS